MKLETLRNYIVMGREIEFSYGGKMYSITYTFANKKQTVHFCQFNNPSEDYDSVDDFFSSATIGEEYLRDILGLVEDTVVY